MSTGIYLLNSHLVVAHTHLARRSVIPARVGSLLVECGMCRKIVDPLDRSLWGEGTMTHGIHITCGRDWICRTMVLHISIDRVDLVDEFYQRGPPSTPG